ncbi:MAG: tellurite resistance TerB family protein [Bdellovibrionales bacterium]|nr:tellurite resistance TerB family protein [Bdellovibrionales bacterium]
MEVKKNKLSASEMNKWRTIVALAHVDGHATMDEKTFILDTLKNRDIDPEQFAVIEKDFTTAQNPAELFKLIDSPRDRGLLFHTARMMFYKDNDFSSFEKMYFEKFEAAHMGTLDLALIIKEVDAVKKEMEDHESYEGSDGFKKFQSLMNRFF